MDTEARWDALIAGSLDILEALTAEALADYDAGRTCDIWDVLDSLIGTVDAPEDWATNHDHYLYETPKRED